MWDLREAQQSGAIDWSKACPLDTSYVEPDSFNIGEHRPPTPETEPTEGTVDIEEMARLSGFKDYALLYDLKYACSNDADVPRHTILSPHHTGALEHWQQISDQMDKELAQGWWDGPYSHPPLYPFRMVPRNVVTQPRPDGTLKYRICVDLSWPHDGTAPNFHIDLAKQPMLQMAKLANLAAAADILHFAGGQVYGFGIDLEAAYRQWAKRTEDIWQQVLLWFQQQPDGTFRPAWYVDKRTTFGDAIMVHKFSRVSDMIAHFTRFRLRATKRHSDPPEPHLRQWREWRRSLYPDEPEQWDLFYNFVYIDDHAVVTVGAERAEADRLDIFDITNKTVGCPAQPAKNDPPSASELTQLGGTLKFGPRWFDRSDKFAKKFAARLDELLASEEWTFDVCRSTAYMANHLAQFRPNDRPQCAPLFAEMRRLLRQGGRGSHKIPAAPLEALRFWRLDVWSAGGMPFFPALQMPVRGHPRRCDAETDASGKIGYGAFLHPPGDDTSVAPMYFWGKWTAAELPLHINVKELLVTYWLVTLLGELVPGMHVHESMFCVEHIDNTTAIGVARRNAATTVQLNAIAKLRSAAVRRNGWTLEQAYINTKLNVRADALSRDDWKTFIDSVRAAGYAEPVEITIDAALRDTSFLTAAAAGAGTPAP